MRCNEVLQSFPLSAKAKKTTNGISERKGKEVQNAILAKDVEWYAWFEELAEQVTKLSKARCLDAQIIAEMKTRIPSHPSTALAVRDKIAEASPAAPHPSPPSGSHHVRDQSPSPPPENNDDK
jgi:hypothetical protein